MAKKILIVDDEHGIRVLLEVVFTGGNYFPITAATGKEALELIGKYKIDLMIMDYKLPIIDGIEVLKKLREEDIRIPTIMMSGLPEAVSDAVREMPFVKKVLAKPFNVQDIVNLASSILDEGT